MLGVDAATDCGKKGTAKTENGIRKAVGLVGFGGGMIMQGYGVQYVSSDVNRHGHCWEDANFVSVSCQKRALRFFSRKAGLRKRKCPRES